MCAFHECRRWVEVVLLVGHPMNSLDVLLDIGKNSRDFSCEGWYDNVAIREFYQAIHLICMPCYDFRESIDL